MDLENAIVVGFFSLPSPSLAEVHPSAYQAAMREAPKGAGSCQHCGTGILHHVIVQLPDKSRSFIGRDCALRVGSPMTRRCIREQKTAEQIAETEARSIAVYEERQRECAALEAAHQLELEARFEELRDIIEPLEAKGTEFHLSLALQLRSGSLSPRQAEFAVKGILGRYSKRVAEQWNSIYERCMAA